MNKFNLVCSNYSNFKQEFFLYLTETHQTNKHNKGIDSWTHLITMLFCQFSKLTSLNDVTTGLKSASGNLNHLGLRISPSKSSLSYQNKNRE
ncbi:DUF4372 domain-containing protein [Carboxylicivirga sp. N1Y90]|uniref:DUF4372 domain-containing protein n=1 Tax=Carboxylicivirga fragile TaxID=3417571 RepID=UPI003D344141|nr:DUF4372 domain-containing protein [Marinilabiliaceae bacterium N1Y90]